MTTFRYQAIERNGSLVDGVIEAADRKGALLMLGERGLFPSSLVASTGVDTAADETAAQSKSDAPGRFARARPWGARVRRKDVTAFTRELASLLQASIPIPQALDGLSEEEENPALREVVSRLADSVRKGASLSAALEEHPRMFSRLYVSMVRVGEEAGVLQKVMTDLAGLLEHEDEIRGEVMSAIAYPVFVLAFGLFTVIILLTVVLPKLFAMLQEMADNLPMPTRVLLAVSDFFQTNWWWVFPGLAGAAWGLRRYVRSPAGALAWDGWKLRLPVLGGVLRAAALGRFARTLGTLLKSGVSLLPALKIVEHTIGNLRLSRLIARVAEETRGGDSLGTPLRKLSVFPRTVVQMISVGEETGQLDEMLLRIAEIEERHMRSHIKTLISLLAPALILAVGVLVGFMVLALLLPIFKMSQAVR
jgi:type II secretory pathway component PulF